MNVFKMSAACLGLSVSVGCGTMKDAYEIKPDGQDAMPTLAEWQAASEADLTSETSAENLAHYVASTRAADALLGQVRPAYATGPLTATKIAAVSQFVLRPDLADGAASRRIWRAALLRAAESCTDAYRKTFFLDQLRWCGTADDVARIRQIANDAESEEVREFCALVIRELTARTAAACTCPSDVAGKRPIDVSRSPKTLMIVAPKGTVDFTPDRFVAEGSDAGEYEANGSWRKIISRIRPGDLFVLRFPPSPARDRLAAHAYGQGGVVLAKSPEAGDDQTDSHKHQKCSAWRGAIVIK